MNSGQYITLFLLAPISLWVLVFVAWELIQAARKGPSTLTASQYLLKLAKSGNKWALVYILALPVFLMMVASWLLVHWGSLCFWFNILCELDI